MLMDGVLIHDGGDMVSYLDQKLQGIAADGKTVSGIIVSTDVRKALSQACMRIMGHKPDPNETINKFRDILLIEDGETPDRLEIVYGPRVVPPVEGTPFSRFGRL